MPIVSGGGGGGGNTTAQVVASGKVLPVAQSSGATVNTTTYDDPIAGSGKLTTLVFPADQGVLALAIAGDAFPRVIVASSPNTDAFFYLGNGASDAYGGSGGLKWLDSGHLKFTGSLQVGGAQVAADVPQLIQVSAQLTYTSGALPTQQFVSGAGAFIGSNDVTAHTPVTFNPGVATTATCAVALSPDNVTYSTLAVITKPVGTVFDGEIDDVCVPVPGGWYLKLTVVNATLGLTTYY